ADLRHASRRGTGSLAGVVSDAPAAGWLAVRVVVAARRRPARGIETATKPRMNRRIDPRQTGGRFFRRPLDRGTDLRMMLMTLPRGRATLGGDGRRPPAFLFAPSSPHRPNHPTNSRIAFPSRTIATGLPLGV